MEYSRVENNKATHFMAMVAIELGPALFYAHSTMVD